MRSAMAGHMAGFLPPPWLVVAVLDAWVLLIEVLRQAELAPSTRTRT